ncbi:hypothetical protein KIH39_15935 [Telmatocola sphagniphila]|uniref:Uncharacterized protein n=1 Tax=Telmatocola sphagniphila TaxID=1123043 RepID=A0A8E6EWN5_9BACT|nr:hypothetical protein [Telmatocola sphagniphila]QVL30270.1 hypothetical protein KIH39_15570 [Telmatocola sphagniphila]QVL30341.1 hypothetical protein KIH39_15935 [Telmatocola sphagniphila]
MLGRIRDLNLGDSRNPRYNDLKKLLQNLNKFDPEDKSLLISGLVAVAEYSCYATAGFVEHYNSFESDNNNDLYPSLVLSYKYEKDGVISSEDVASYQDGFSDGSFESAFMKVASSPQMKDLVQSKLVEILAKLN